MPDDATVIVELPTEEMMDLPAGFGVFLLSETSGNIQGTNAAGRDTTALAAGVLKAAMARNFDELGTVEGRSTSGVLATPIASPTTQSGGA